MAIGNCPGIGQNAARRIMQVNGIREDQVTQVRGFADQRLRKPDSATGSLEPANFLDCAVSGEKTWTDAGAGERAEWRKRRRCR